MEEETAAPAKPVSRWDVPVEDSTEEDGWLLVYLDVMTLLVVMFVVMLTFAGEGQDEHKPQAAETPTEDPAPTTQSSGMAQKWKPGELGEDIEVSAQGESVRFRISSEILFESGRAQLSMRGLDALDRLIPALESNEHEIRVAGHTDDVPIRTARFPSNWELSSARAGKVVRYLESQGIPPDRMVALGYAHTQPRGSNETLEGRARNRRVELILNPMQAPGSGAVDDQ